MKKNVVGVENKNENIIKISNLIASTLPVCVSPNKRMSSSCVYENVQIFFVYSNLDSMWLLRQHLKIIINQAENFCIFELKLSWKFWNVFWWWWSEIKRILFCLPSLYIFFFGEITTQAEKREKKRVFVQKEFGTNMARMRNIEEKWRRSCASLLLLSPVVHIFFFLFFRVLKKKLHKKKSEEKKVSSQRRWRWKENKNVMEWISKKWAKNTHSPWETTTLRPFTYIRKKNLLLAKIAQQ